MEPIRTLIVDDEPLARRRLQKLLQDDREIEVIGLCENGEQAIKTINHEHPELVFLDVQMPVIDGFEVLRQVEAGHYPVIVFVTAYDEYALKAFEVHALDYLLKPFDRARFQRALKRAKSHIRSSALESTNHRLEEMLKQLQSDVISRVMVKSNGRVFFVDVDDIDWIEASGNYVQLHTGSKTHLVRDTMSNMEEKLDPDRFFRIHRSTIVNIERVKELQSWFHGDYMVILKDGNKLTMSRNYKQLLQKY